MKTPRHIVPVRISGLSEGVHHLDVTAPAGQLGLPPEFPDDFAIHIDLDRTHSQLVMHVMIQSRAVYPCDRCLAPVTIPIEDQFTLFYTHDGSSAQTLREDDVRILDPNEPVVDIADDVRDVALLRIPMRRTCGEDANGNPTCATQVPLACQGARELDPRWEALRQWNQQ